MKKLRFVVILALIAAVGFMLGRLTADTQFIEVIDGKREIPLFPAPPKEEINNGAVNASPKEADPEMDLILEVPVEGAQVSDAFLDVAGRAKTGSGAVHIVVEASDGAVLAETAADVELSTGPFGRFSKTIIFDTKPSGTATVTVTLASDQNQVVRRTVEFVDSTTVPVKVYFSNGTIDPAHECSLVFPVDRQVPSRAAIYRAAIEELIKGPTAAEKEKGYTTSLPKTVVIKSVVADANGIVTADFTESLEKGVAGSCRVTAIRAQITATLRQFPEVRDVIISINGRTEDILQP